MAMDHGELSRLINELARSLAKSETSALNYFDILKKMMINSSFKDPLNGIETHIKAFDFDAAAPLLHDLAKTLGVNLQK
ncbi:MAG: hypothetical protein HQK66_09975 [Desulfamplus sp.]|nr:hypothetical protein [Desulfamplus sp.]